MACRFRAENVALDVGENFNVSLVPLHFSGHALYCRKCVTGDLAENARHEFDRVVGGIILPETAVDTSFWLEVLALGPNVGRPCSRLHARKFRRARCIVSTYEVGDMILCPVNDDAAIFRSPLNRKSEFFIEESFPVAIYRATAAA